MAMAETAVSKAALEAVTSENLDTTAKINQLATQLRANILPQDEVNGQIKTLLLGLYDSITTLSRHTCNRQVPNDDIFPVWRSFLAPIGALSQLPSGHFLSARMALYLCSGLLNQRCLNKSFARTADGLVSRPLYRLCGAIDEALLASLRSIWIASDESERFDWVFTRYPLCAEESLDEGTTRCRVIAQALTAEELFALGGIDGRRFIWAMSADEREGDVEEWKPFSGGLPGDAAERVKYAVPDDERVKPGECFWRQVGSDGPIRGRFCYYSTWRRPPNGRLDFLKQHIELLARSRQFVVDARRMTELCLTEPEYAAVHEALARAKMPPEIRKKIISHVEHPKRHAYIRHIDLAKAYAPFPANEQSCERCSRPTTLEAERLTCPESTFFVWNFALRAFLTCHRHSVKKAALCRHGLDCHGHHHEDHDWEIDNEAAFENLIQGIVKQRCGSGMTLDLVGLGLNREITVVSEEEAREMEQRLVQPRGPLEDAATEMVSNGGFCGLVHFMLYGRILVESSPGRYRHTASWGLARDWEEYLKAIQLVWGLQGWSTR